MPPRRPDLGAPGPQHRALATPRHILALSGGGFRGLFTARVLELMETERQEQIGPRFDLIAGTSIGGILAIGLACGLNAAHLRAKFQEHGEAIFRWRASGAGGYLRSRYGQGPLKKAIETILGGKAQDTIANLSIPICVVAIDEETAKPRIFRSNALSPGEGDKIALIDVAPGDLGGPYLLSAASDRRSDIRRWRPHRQRTGFGRRRRGQPSLGDPAVRPTHPEYRDGRQSPHRQGERPAGRRRVAGEQAPDRDDDRRPGEPGCRAVEGVRGRPLLADRSDAGAPAKAGRRKSRRRPSAAQARRSGGRPDKGRSRGGLDALSPSRCGALREGHDFAERTGSSQWVVETVTHLGPQDLVNHLTTATRSLFDLLTIANDDVAEPVEAG
ncbi:MAG: patatin-like phospholipase family protein [Alphaproteobacteria bacterium]|nr:patatin-like phospholipase family protein [Alphaproteobacteria bacterium]